MTIKELRLKSELERSRELLALRAELGARRFERASLQLKNHRAMRTARKTIARILTIKRNP